MDEALSQVRGFLPGVAVETLTDAAPNLKALELLVLWGRAVRGELTVAQAWAEMRGFFPSEAELASPRLAKVLRSIESRAVAEMQKGVGECVHIAWRAARHEISWKEALQRIERLPADSAGLPHPSREELAGDLAAGLLQRIKRARAAGEDLEAVALEQLTRILWPDEREGAGIVDLVRGRKDAERDEKARAGSRRTGKGRPARIGPAVRAEIIRQAEALWRAAPALRSSAIESARKLLAKFAGEPGPLGAVADLHPKTVARVLREHALKESSTKG